MNLKTLLFICENFACRGESAIKDLYLFLAGRQEDCVTEELAEMSDWLLVAALELPEDSPLADEINELADRIDAFLRTRGWTHPILDDLPKDMLE